MECRNHAGVEAADRCSSCMEPFCGNCLVTLRGRRFCGSCKMTALGSALPVVEQATEECEEAREALKYAIIGIFCFSIILEPIAISKALKAKKMIAANPNLTGYGKANGALLIGILALVMGVVGMIARVRGA